MGVPLRVATATSNLMIGITAAASAVIYLIRGGIDPYVAGPTAIGVFVGATLGSRVAPPGRRPRSSACCSSSCSLYTAVQMLLRASDDAPTTACRAVRRRAADRPAADRR